MEYSIPFFFHRRVIISLKKIGLLLSEQD
jgi:hypothetical protein